MKKLVLIISGFAIALSACTTTHQQPVGMANPASVYCVNQGGKSVIQKDATGAEVGYCHLPNGQVMEEWALYRMAKQ